MHLCPAWCRNRAAHFMPPSSLSVRARSLTQIVQANVRLSRPMLAFIQPLTSHIARLKSDKIQRWEAQIRYVRLSF
jgi:hypothetical protein